MFAALAGTVIEGLRASRAFEAAAQLGAVRRKRGEGRKREEEVARRGREFADRNRFFFGNFYSTSFLHHFHLPPSTPSTRPSTSRRSPTSPRRRCACSRPWRRSPTRSTRRRWRTSDEKRRSKPPFRARVQTRVLQPRRRRRGCSTSAPPAATARLAATATGTLAARSTTSPAAKTTMTMKRTWSRRSSGACGG